MSRCSAGVEPNRKMKMSCFPQTEGETIAQEEHLAETRISDANWFPEFIACQVCFEANDVWRLRKFRLIHNIVGMGGDSFSARSTASFVYIFCVCACKCVFID